MIQQDKPAIQVAPEIALHEALISKQFLENRCLRLAQALAEVAGERDQAIADRDAIRAELDALKRPDEGGDNGDSE